MKDLLIRFAKDESGATMAEYGIMLALIAAIAIAVVAVLGQQIRDAFQAVVDCIRDPAACGGG